MIFTEKTKTILEFDRIIQMLVRHCATGGATACANALFPSDDPVVVKRRLQRTTDAKRLADVKGYPSFDADESVLDAAERVEKGSTLTTVELLQIAAMLRSVKSCMDYAHDDRTFATVLDEVFDRLLPNQTLERKIRTCILSPDVIADDASPALADIRRNIRAAHARIKDSLLGYISGSHRRALQENIVTMRDGRYVIPIKQEYRSEVKGIIHDTSSSGATVFVEPMTVVEANNDLRTLEMKEQREIERILAELSAACADFAGSLKLNYKNLTELSFSFACAALSYDMDACEPEISEEQVIDLKNGRHPLIEKSQVVPISICLGREYDTLIITGPNTGGKTVTMKTMGLFVVMTQCGLHIPTNPGSVIGTFDAVLADIGDEQSIEQSLSTFSSHMVNVVGILRDVTPRSLVLYDELGAGTDPVEGAALAIAILEQTARAGALCAATTHYTELKMYALDTPRVTNASCEFDVETLRPTYRLLVGTPGKSNAFAISEKLGIPTAVVAYARSLMTEDNRRFENVITRLDAMRGEAEKAKTETEKMRREYEIFKRKEEIRLKEQTAEMERAIRQDREKARQLLDSARISSEFVFKQIDDLRKKQNSHNLAEELERTRRAVREQIRNGEQDWSKVEFRERTNDGDYHLSRPLKVGDKIYIITYHSEGEVTALPNEKTVDVRAGVFRGKVPLADVRLMEDMPTSPKEKRNKKDLAHSAVSVSREGVAGFHAEIDVRGRYGDDAWFEVDRYLDEAVLSGLETVRIIHGKGTGALRVALHKELKSDPRVKSYRLGNVGEGDAGVTVITLK